MKHHFHIPVYLQVAGQRVDVRNVDRCPDDEFARCSLASSEIQIAEYCRSSQKQSDYSKVNSYYHELIHLILDNMGQYELSKDEKFVSTFAGFLTEAMVTAEFEEDTSNP